MQNDQIHELDVCLVEKKLLYIYASTVIKFFLVFFLCCWLFKVEDSIVFLKIISSSAQGLFHS